MSDSPSESKRIRAVERDYIVHSLKGQLASPDSKRKVRTGHTLITVNTSEDIYEHVLKCIQNIKK